MGMDGYRPGGYSEEGREWGVGGGIGGLYYIQCTSHTCRFVCVHVGNIWQM